MYLGNYYFPNLFSTLIIIFFLLILFFIKINFESYFYKEYNYFVDYVIMILQDWFKNPRYFILKIRYYF